MMIHRPTFEICSTLQEAARNETRIVSKLLIVSLLPGIAISNCSWLSQIRKKNLYVIIRNILFLTLDLVALIDDIVANSNDFSLFLFTFLDILQEQLGQGGFGKVYWVKDLDGYVFHKISTWFITI